MNIILDILLRMEYNTKTFSQFPYQIHEEFGLLLEDLVNNSPNPTRYRSKVPWRENASKEYEKKAMKFQSNEPNYEEHKITGREKRSESRSLLRNSINDIDVSSLS